MSRKSSPKTKSSLMTADQKVKIAKNHYDKIQKKSEAIKKTRLEREKLNPPLKSSKIKKSKAEMKQERRKLKEIKYKQKNEKRNI